MPTKTKSRPANDDDLDTEDAELPLPDRVEIPFNGVTFTVLRDRGEWSTESTLAHYQAVATGLNINWVSYVELVLGPEQWRSFLLIATKKRDLVAFIKLFIDVTNKECVD